MAKPPTLFVGLDVHKDSVAVAHAQGHSADPPVFVGAIGPGQADLDKLIRRLQGKASDLVFAYEAGPNGYVLHRYLTGTRAPAAVRRPDDRLRAERRR